MSDPASGISPGVRAGSLSNGCSRHCRLAGQSSLTLGTGRPRVAEPRKAPPGFAVRAATAIAAAAGREAGRPGRVDKRRPQRAEYCGVDVTGPVGKMAVDGAADIAGRVRPTPPRLVASPRFQVPAPIFVTKKVAQAHLRRFAFQRSRTTAIAAHPPGTATFPTSTTWKVRLTAEEP